MGYNVFFLIKYRVLFIPVNADAYGIHVTTCKVANDASFVNDSPGTGPRRSVTFISGGFV